jgi:hypothetical protein
MNAASNAATNVIEFRPKPAPVKLTLAEARRKSRGHWMDALGEIWDSPTSWRTSKNGSRYLILDERDVCVVIEPRESGWSWVIRWRDGRKLASKWVFVQAVRAYDDAWRVVVALA